MVDFVTFKDLQRFNSGISVNEQALIKSGSRTATNKDTFLSHSSQDAEYLPAVINLLENHGASVYCDLGDTSLPKSPNPKTASMIKKQIQNSRRFVLFVTTNSKDSKWVPWELGIGDASLGTTSVALLPAASESYEQSWAQQEYLGLYRHIVWGKLEGERNNVWMVYDHHNNTATKLSKWFRG